VPSPGDGLAPGGRGGGGSCGGMTVAPRDGGRGPGPDAAAGIIIGVGAEINGTGEGAPLPVGRGAGPPSPETGVRYGARTSAMSATVNSDARSIERRKLITSPIPPRSKEFTGLLDNAAPFETAFVQRRLHGST